MRTLPKVATEMALAVLAFNLTRVMNIMGVKPLIAVMQARKMGAGSPRPKTRRLRPPVRLQRASQASFDEKAA